MRLHVRGLLCCLVGLCVSEALSGIYWVRRWENTTYGAAFSMPYISMANAYDQWISTFDQGERHKVLYSPASGNVLVNVPSWPTDMMCPFAAGTMHFRPYLASAGTGHYFHVPSQSSDNGRHLWIFNITPGGANTTVTNWWTYPIVECQRCRTGSGNYEAIAYTPKDYRVDSANVPQWVFDNPDWNNAGFAFSPDGSEITGYTGAPNPAAAPDGAITSGTEKNGYWDWSENEPPHWTFYPGMEPGGETGGSTEQQIADMLTAAQTSADQLTAYSGKFDTFAAATSASLGGIGDKLQTANNNMSAFQLDYAASHGQLLTTIGGVVAAVNDVKTAVQNAPVGSGGSGTADQETAENTGSMDGKLSNIESGVNAIKNAVEGSMGQRDDSDAEADPEAETDALLEAMGEAANRKNAGLSKGIDLSQAMKDAQYEGVNRLTSLHNIVTGSWKNLDRTPIADVEKTYSIRNKLNFTIKVPFSQQDFFFQMLRAVEVLMLWAYFVYRLMGLYSCYVGNAKGES